MASTKLMETKSGRRYWKISVSRGYGVSPYTTRFYWQDGWSQKYAEQQMRRYAAEFEQQCRHGEVLSRSEKKKVEALEAAEAAKLKTVRQYTDGVFMPTKMLTISDNSYANYRQMLDSHILPVIGDVLLTDVSPAMLRKLLLGFQTREYSTGKKYAHATVIKLYNILNGLFDMAFQDDSIPISPMLKVKRPAARSDEVPKEESEKAFSAAEMERILNYMEREPLQWQTFIRLMIDTGIRRGECCGIQWSDINFENASVVIRHNLQYTAQRGVFDKRPKNKKVRQQPSSLY